MSKLLLFNMDVYKYPRSFYDVTKCSLCKGELGLHYLDVCFRYYDKLNNSVKIHVIPVCSNCFKIRIDGKSLNKLNHIFPMAKIKKQNNTMDNELTVPFQFDMRKWVADETETSELKYLIYSVFIKDEDYLNE